MAGSSAISLEILLHSVRGRPFTVSGNWEDLRSVPGWSGSFVVRRAWRVPRKRSMQLDASGASQHDRALDPGQRAV